MTDDQLDQIIELASEEFPERLGELHEHILQAAAEALEATQDSDTAKPKVSVNLKLVIDLSKSPPTFLTKGSVGVTFTTEGEQRSLDDPDQPDLGFPEPTVSFNGSPHVPVSVAKAALKEVRREKRQAKRAK